jgi:hypothetical protein
MDLREDHASGNLRKVQRFETTRGADWCAIPRSCSRPRVDVARAGVLNAHIG